MKGKHSFIEGNLVIFQYPKLICTLEVPKRDKFVCEPGFVSLFFFKHF